MYVYSLSDFVWCTNYAVTSCMCVLFIQVVSFCVVVLAKVCWLFGNIHAKLCCSQSQCVECTRNKRRVWTVLIVYTHVQFTWSEPLVTLSNLINLISSFSLCAKSWAGPGNRTNKICVVQFMYNKLLSRSFDVLPSCETKSGTESLGLRLFDCAHLAVYGSLYKCTWLLVYTGI